MSRMYSCSGCKVKKYVCTSADMLGCTAAACFFEYEEYLPLLIRDKTQEV